MLRPSFLMMSLSFFGVKVATVVALCFFSSTRIMSNTLSGMFVYSLPWVWDIYSMK